VRRVQSYGFGVEKKWIESTRQWRNSVWKKQHVRRADVEPCMNFVIDKKTKILQSV
jgi:hypothetical protein